MTGRPRRSTASVKSYAIPSLTELDSDPDNGDGGADFQDDTPEASTSTAPPKSKGKAKATSKGKGRGRGKKAKSESDSGSDFGEELAKQAQPSTEEDDDFQDDAVEEEEDDEPVDGSSDATLEAKATAKKKTARGTAPAKFRGTDSTKVRAGAKGLSARVRQAKSTPASIKKALPPAHPDDSGYTRVLAPPAVYEPTADPELATFGPLFEPPVRRIDPSTGEEVTGPALNEYQRSVVLQMWADAPFFPKVGGSCDLGWRKGKWSVEGERQNQTWGGWYPTKSSESWQIIDQG